MNINEITKIAGASRATVKPSTHAQTLRTKKTKLIGVILPKINSETII